MLAVLAGCAAAAVPATSALASPTPEGGIRAGNHVMVVHNIDLVAAWGYAQGERVRIEVLRGPNTISRVRAPALAVEDSFGLELNHGPEGAARPGDCFSGVTPDVRPGDRIRVTDSSGGVDQVLVDDISIDSIEDDPASDDVLVKGVAQYATGSTLSGAIPAAALDSGFWRSRNVPSGDARGDSPAVSTTTDGSYTARYGAPSYGVFRGGPVTQADVLGADHEFGYGHTEPLPAEIQLVDGLGESPGPAPGCEAAPAAGRDAITTSDESVVTASSGTLAVSGTASDATTGVSVTLADSAGGSTVVDATPSLFAGMSGEKSWSAEFTRAQLDGLADGRLTATATFANGTVPTSTWQLRKEPPDTTGPVMGIAGADTRMTRSGNVNVNVTCPAAEVSGPCTGRLRLKAGERMLGVESFTIATGDRAPVSVSLSGAARDLVRRRGSVDARATATASDRVGNVGKSSRTITVRAPRGGGGGGRG